MPRPPLSPDEWDDCEQILSEVQHRAALIALAWEGYDDPPGIREGDVPLGAGLLAQQIYAEAQRVLEVLEHSRPWLPADEQAEARSSRPPPASG